MTKEEMVKKLQTDTMTLDDFRNLPSTMNETEVGDVLVELAYALYVECRSDETKANQALLACLLERWWDLLEEP